MPRGRGHKKRKYCKPCGEWHNHRTAKEHVPEDNASKHNQDSKQDNASKEPQPNESASLNDNKKI